MGRPGWGHIVQAVLPAALAGCAAQEPPPPRSPPAVEAPPPAIMAAPEPAAGVGPLALALAASTSKPRALFFEASTVRFGNSAFLHNDYSWSRASPPCPLAQPAGESPPCALFAVARGPSLTWSEPRPAPQHWVAFARGRSVTYARREGQPVVIDAIDADGKVTLWLEDPAFHSWSEFQVIESAGGDWIVGLENEDFQLGRVEVTEGKRSLSEVTPLPLSSTNSRANANQARRVVADEKMPTWGPWSAVSINEQKDAWALVFTEVIPPPPSAPEGKHFQPRGRAKHGCGGKLSRKLFDLSVTKRLHVMRFAGSRKTADAVETLPDNHDASRVKFEVAAAGGHVGVWLDGVAHGDKDVPAPPAPPPLPPSPLPTTLPEPEEARALAFDRPSGEGILVVARGDDESYGRLFDATGAFTSPAFPLPDGIASREPPALVRLPGGWIAHDMNEPQIAWLTGDHAGQTARSPARARSAWLVATDATHAALLWQDNKTLMQAEISANGSVGPATALRTISRLVGAFRRESDGAPVLVDQAYELFDLRTEEKIETVPPPRMNSRARLVFPWGTVALALTDDRNKGEIWRFPAPEKETPDAEDKDRQTADTERQPKAPEFEKIELPSRNPEIDGPVLEGGLVVPEKPGPLLRTPAGYRETLCPRSVATGPRRVVLACAEGTASPGVRVGLRTMIIETAQTP